MRRRYYLIFILSTLIPLLTLAIISFLFVPLQQDGITHRRLTAAFSGFSKFIDKRGFELLSRTAAMASSSPLHELLLTFNQIGYFDQPAFIEQSLRQLSMSNLDYLMVTDPQGNIIAQGHDPSGIGGSATDDPLVIRALTGQKISSTGIRRIRGRWEVLMLASVPIMFRNRIIGTLTAGTIMDEDLLESAKSLSGGEFILVVGGTAKISTVDKEMDQRILFVQGEGMQTFEIGGIKHRFASFPLIDFAGENVADIILGVNIAEIEAISANFARLFSLLFIASTVLSVVIVKYYSTKIDRQIAMIADGLSRIAGGELSASISINPHDELRELSLHLNAAAAELKDRFENAVESERTITLTHMADKIGARIRKTAEILRGLLNDLNRKTAELSSAESDKTAKNVQRLSAEINSLVKLGDTLLEFTNLPPPTLQLISLDGLKELIQSNYGDEIKSGDLTITIREPAAAIQADPVQLRRMFDCLIQNAFEASGPSGRVEIIIEADNGRARITVSDNGPGFSELALKNLFRPFFSTKPGGNGLGLMMAKKIIMNHDGKIEAGNAPAGGAIVRLRFDIADMP